MSEIKSNPPSETIIRIPGEFGDAIKEARKRAGLSQADAAAMCKLGTRFLSDLENGKSSVHLGKALQVLRAFGLVIALRKKTLSDE